VTDEVIAVDVDGRPAPKGSRITGTSKAGNTYTYPASKYEKPWVDAVKGATQIVMRHYAMPEPPYRVDLEFRLAKPRQRRYEFPPVPDIDKLARATVDGLVAGKALRDDRFVTILTATKRYVRPGESPGVHAEIESVPALAVIAA
jgi:Holliday junction resolvase RusA-like endonuclease